MHNLSSFTTLSKNSMCPIKIYKTGKLEIIYIKMVLQFIKLLASSHSTFVVDFFFSCLQEVTSPLPLYSLVLVSRLTF